MMDTINYGILCTLYSVDCIMSLYTSEPGYVANPRITESGAYHFKVEWEPPAQPNGVIVGYTVGHKVCE